MVVRRSGGRGGGGGAAATGGRVGGGGGVVHCVWSLKGREGRGYIVKLYLGKGQTVSDAVERILSI